jgi:hypothetical protein
MSRRQFVISLFLAVLVLGLSTAEAKRSAPAPVAPIDAGDVRLVVEHFDNACKQTGGCVEVIDKKTQKRVRAVKVYTTVRDPKLEADVQDVFITEVKVNGKRVTVKDEAGRTHGFDL